MVSVFAVIPSLLGLYSCTHHFISLHIMRQMLSSTFRTEVLFSLHRFCSFPRFCKQSILKEGKKIYSPNPTKKQCESQRYHQSYYAARSIAAIRDIINSTHGIATLLPSALYLALSEASGMSVHPSGNPCRRSHSRGVKRRIR